MVAQTNNFEQTDIFIRTVNKMQPYEIYIDFVKVHTVEMCSYRKQKKVEQYASPSASCISSLFYQA